MQVSSSSVLLQSPLRSVIMTSTLLCLLSLSSLVLSDISRNPTDDNDNFAPNSVPMMGKRLYRLLPRYYYHRSLVPLPMLRLKKEERESPFIYKTPWHIGKRLSPDVKRSPMVPYANWIGSLFKPAQNKNNRLPKLPKGICYALALTLFWKNVK